MYFFHDHLFVCLLAGLCIYYWFRVRENNQKICLGQTYIPFHGSPSGLPALTEVSHPRVLLLILKLFQLKYTCTLVGWVLPVPIYQ